VRAAWPGVSVRYLGEVTPVLPRTARLAVRVAVQLNGLHPDDVAVEFVATRRLPHDATERAALSSYNTPTPAYSWQAPLRSAGSSDGAMIFEGDLEPPASGQYLMEVRVRPTHRLLTHPQELGLLKTA
jgi:starch phosphorylase